MDAAHLSKVAARQHGSRDGNCSRVYFPPFHDRVSCGLPTPWALGLLLPGSCYLVPAVGLRHRLHVPES